MGQFTKEQISYFDLRTARTNYRLGINGKAAWVGFTKGFLPFYDPNRVTNWPAPPPNSIQLNYCGHEEIGRNQSPIIRLDNMAEAPILITRPTLIKRRFEEIYLTNLAHNTGVIKIISSADPDFDLKTDYEYPKYLGFENDIFIDTALSTTQHYVLRFLGNWFRYAMFYFEAQVIAGAPDTATFVIQEFAIKDTLLPTPRTVGTASVTAAAPTAMTGVLDLLTNYIGIDTSTSNLPGGDALIRMRGIYW